MVTTDNKNNTRNRKVRVKTAKGRKLSSTLWLQRQLNDQFVNQAKQDGYRARSAYKLIEIDTKFKLLKPGYIVVDLGAAPGGWSQVAADLVIKGHKGKVIAVDLSEIKPIPGVTTVQSDFTELATQDMIKNMLPAKVNVVLSDMAAPASGHNDLDHIRIMALCEQVLDFAIEVLAVGGSIATKILTGSEESRFLTRLKPYFTEVKRFKPEASRSDSAEMYIIAKGFKK